MPDIPAEAVQAAARTLTEQILVAESDEALARLILEAAAPLIVQHVGNLLDWRALAAAERETLWQCHHGTPGCHQAGAVEALADAARIAREAFTAGERSGGGAPVRPSAAPHGAQGPEVAPVYPSGPEKTAETLSALRDRYAAALASTCRLHEVTGECTACERRLAAVLAVQDDEIARLRREVAYVARTGEMWRQLWERVDRERSDALVRAEQAEDAIARVKGLHSEIPYKPGFCYCANPYPCPTIRALDGAGAVSEEQTGGGNG